MHSLPLVVVVVVVVVVLLLCESCMKAALLNGTAPESPKPEQINLRADKALLAYDRTLAEGSRPISIGPPRRRHSGKPTAPLSNGRWEGCKNGGKADVQINHDANGPATSRQGCLCAARPRSQPAHCVGRRRNRTLASIEQVVGASTVILSPFSRAQALIRCDDAVCARPYPYCFTTQQAECDCILNF